MPIPLNRILAAAERLSMARALRSPADHFTEWMALACVLYGTLALLIAARV